MSSPTSYGSAVINCWINPLNYLSYCRQNPKRLELEGLKGYRVEQHFGLMKLEHLLRPTQTKAGLWSKSQTKHPAAGRLIQTEVTEACCFRFVEIY